MGAIDDIYPKIGKRIQQARKLAGLTQERLAEKTSLSRTSITNIEKGRQKFLIHTLFDLARALQLNPRDLLPEEISGEVGSIENKLPKELSKKEVNWIKTIMEEGGNYGDSKKGN